MVPPRPLRAAIACPSVFYVGIWGVRFSGEGCGSGNGDAGSPPCGVIPLLVDDFCEGGLAIWATSPYLGLVWIFFGFWLILGVSHAGVTG